MPTQEEIFMDTNRDFEVRQLNANDYAFISSNGQYTTNTDEMFNRIRGIIPREGVCVFVDGIVYRAILLPVGYNYFVNLGGDHIHNGDIVYENFPHNTLVFNNNGDRLTLNLDLTTWHGEQTVTLSAPALADALNSVDELNNQNLPPNPEPTIASVDPAFGMYMRLMETTGVDMISRCDKQLKQTIRNQEYQLIRLEDKKKNILVELNEMKNRQREVALDKRRMKSMITKGYEPTMDVKFMNKIESVHYQKWDNKLFIKTKFLSIPYDVKVSFYKETVMFPIGEFQITINMGTHQVYFKNLTRVIRNEYLHPHIMLETTCWGNFNYREVLSSNNLADILCSFISYLESYNHQSPYLNLLEGWNEYLPEVDQICKYTCKFLQHKDKRPKQLVNDEPRHPVYKLPMSMVPYAAIKFPSIPQRQLAYYTDMSRAVIDEIFNDKVLNPLFIGAVSRGNGTAQIVNTAIKQIRTRALQPRTVASGSSN